MRRALLTAGIIFALFSVSFTQTDKAGLKNITNEEFKEMLSAKDFTLVDVHVPEAKHLQETDEFIPYDQIKKNLGKLPDKNAKILVYCRSGRMSEDAGQELVTLGYANVYNVQGGFYGMKKAGIPITGPDRVIYLTAKKYSFDPDTMYVKLNDKVRIVATSVDVTHGFSLSDFGVRQELPPGKRKVIEFKADKRGVFVYECFVYCGSGHSKMKGKLVVE
jgi:heme/copper-type cytochrome/quinol oxidase subunit 2